MKVLVSGGAGYIGSVMVDALVDGGADVVVLDNLSAGHRDAVNDRASLVVADLRDASATDAAVAEHLPDAVMHFASRALVGESVEHPMLYLGDNVMAGIHLLDACMRHGVRRFVLSSTANLFGRPSNAPLTEAAEISPGSPYGESKAILERMLHWLAETQGLRYAALRYFNAAGATGLRGEDHDPETHLIPLVLQVALGRRSHITVFGDDYDTPDGTCVRDYIHVADLARAHLLALTALDTRCCTYNLGNGRGFSVREVVETARRVTGHDIPMQIGERRAGDPPMLVASSAAISAELGWVPAHPDLKEIIASAWRWHREFPNGYCA